jgi:molybdopterin synthase sulfur carrier subunit
MGLDAIIYGRIVTPYLTWPGDRDARLIQRRNMEMIGSLPDKDHSPSPLVGGMFALPNWEGGLHMDYVIPFGGSLEDDSMSRDWWDAWLTKFESLLRNLYWDSVVLHIESRFAFNGHRMFQWSPTDLAATWLWAEEPQPIREWNRTVRVLREGQPGLQGTTQEEKVDSTRIRIRIPRPLRQYTQGKGIVDVGGATVQEMLEELSRLFPSMALLTLYNRGQIHLFVNDDDIRYTGKLTTAVKAGDEVTIMPAIAGG